ncbi:hypothetical protein COU76_00740 [Candidatus Peregrinibacteria bacterium CG10_big_fil_rev_8_21_14_0_10_49_10]|nr:MAG: hypothetical protein COU76_00740 [Candidatus Peregrinibacteria bacterium CG10_big_fil_rev_8_21_14_0_10_49_10]
MPAATAYHPLAANINVRMREEPIRIYLDLKTEERCLDIGCGLGYMLSKLQNVGAELHGIDTSQESVEYVQKHITPHAKVGSCISIPYPDNHFDKALFCEVIEHVEDDRTALQEIYRVLKPGGRVVISTPAYEGFFTRTYLKRLGHHEGGERHARDGYYRHELQEKLEQSGFTNVQSSLHMFLFSELMMQLTKIGFMAKRRSFKAQSDILEEQRTLPFRCLKAALNVAVPLGRLEDKLCIPLTQKGHALIVAAEKHV